MPEQRPARRSRAASPARPSPASKSRRTSCARHETDVEVFGGEVESLTTAGIEGIGVRVIVDHRQGYASAGSLDPDVIDETLREARDNAAFGEPDEWYALASPADVERRRPPPTSTCGATSCSTCRPTRRSASRSSSKRSTKARDPRVRGVEAAGYGDARSESAIVNSLGVEAYIAPHDVLGARDRARRRRLGHADRLRLRRGPFARRSRPRVDPASTPSTGPCRLLGAEPIAGRRIPVILDPLVTRSVLGVLSSAFNGEIAAEGPVVVRAAARARSSPRRSSRSSTTRPTPRVRRRRLRQRRAADAPQRADRRRCAARLPAQRLHRAPIGSAQHGQRGARRLHVRPRRRCARPARCGRERGRPKRSWQPVAEAFYVQSVSGLHSGTNPISGDFSVGADGLMVRDGAFAEPVREVTIASTLQRMLLDVDRDRRRPHVPARRGRGRDDAGRRDDAQRRLTEAEGDRMPPILVPSASRVEAAGTPPKLIDEYVGRVNTSTDAVSVAHMRSPAGWSEPAQTPEFDEFTVVLTGFVARPPRRGRVRSARGSSRSSRAG